MQKVNFFSILTSHISSLRDDAGGLMYRDLILFFVMPLAFAAATFYCGWVISKDAIGLSVSVFAIFAALLLSVQVALYSVSLRPIEKPQDTKRIRSFENLNRVRFSLLKELNDNIAYLVLQSVFFVTFLLIIYVFSFYNKIVSSISIYLYCHYLLTLLMVVKRASIVFSREYDPDNRGL